MRIAPKSLMAAALLPIASITVAQQDVEGSKDHPLISRYPGSYITWYSVKDFDEYDLPLGEVADAFKPTKSQHLEGKVTMIAYALPEGRSTLEVYRNYESALTRGGFTTLYTCSGLEAPKSCGYMGTWFHDDRRGGGVRVEDHQRYVAAKLARAEGTVFVAVYVDDQSATVDLVEMKPMESGLVTVNASALASDITRTGHASVYGIYFDTGKWDVKPASDAALTEIAKVLQQNPALKLHVVGHTDNVGELPMNLELSRKRAGAVVQILAAKYGIAPARLRPDGVGPLAPVASNESEEGRAKNRRVELVKQ